MTEYYGSSFFREKLGEYVYDLLNPFMSKYGLIIDLGLSTSNELSIKRIDGGYAGKIIHEEGVTKYTIILNENKTLIISGVVEFNKVSGVIERLNKDRRSLNSFSTYRSEIYDHQVKGVKKYYLENVSDITKQINLSFSIWTKKDIDHLLKQYGSNLEPNYIEGYKDTMVEDFANSLLHEFETPRHKSAKIKNTNIC